MKSRGQGSPVLRSDYLIDRFHVVFEWGGGWQCACPDFVASNACRHTREAAGRRAAQAQIALHVGSARSELGRLPEAAGSARGLGVPLTPMARDSRTARGLTRDTDDAPGESLVLSEQ